ncbi:MAG: terminase gpA endonuclease subunit, partial [Syntrophaceae bacterium]
GAAFLHKEVGDDYVAQILAEEKRTNDKGIEEWVNPHNRPNHLLDCEIGAAACVEMEFPGGGLRLLAENLKRQNEKIKTGPAPAQQAVARSKFMS